MKQALLAIILLLVLLTATSQEIRKSDSIITSLQDLLGRNAIIENIVEIAKSQQINFDAAASKESTQDMKNSLRSLQQGKSDEQAQISNQVAQNNKTQINDVAPQNSKQAEQKNTQPLQLQLKNQIQKKNKSTETRTDEDEIEDTEVNQPENSTKTLKKVKEEPKVANGQQKTTTQPTTKPTSVQNNQTPNTPKVQAASNNTVDEDEEEEIEGFQGNNVTSEGEIYTQEEENAEFGQIEISDTNTTESADDDKQAEVEKITNQDPVDQKANNTKDQGFSEFDKPSVKKTVEQNSTTQKSDTPTKQPFQQIFQKDQDEANLTEQSLTNQTKKAKQAQKVENRPVEVNITNNNIVEKITKKPTDQMAQEKITTIQALQEKDTKEKASLMVPVLPVSQKNQTAADKGEKSINVTQKDDGLQKEDEKATSNLTKSEDNQTESNKTEVQSANLKQKQSINSTQAKETPETSFQDNQNNTVQIATPTAEASTTTVEGSKTVTNIENNVTNTKGQNAKEENNGQIPKTEQESERPENNTQSTPATQQVQQNEKIETKLEVNETSTPASPTKAEKEAQNITTSSPTPISVETNEAVQQDHAKQVNQSANGNTDEQNKEQPVSSPPVVSDNKQIQAFENEETQQNPKDKIPPSTQTVENLQKVDQQTQRQQSASSSPKENVPETNEEGNEKAETIKTISQYNPLYKPPVVTEKEQTKEATSLTVQDPKENKVSQEESNTKVEQVHQRDFITENFGDNGYLFVGGIILGSMLVMCIIVKICKGGDERVGFKNMSASEEQYTGSPI